MLKRDIKTLGNAAQRGLNVVSIEKLHEISVRMAREIGDIQPRTEVTDIPVEVVEWRDGTLLDTIFKPAHDCRNG